MSGQSARNAHAANTARRHLPLQRTLSSTEAARHAPLTLLSALCIAVSRILRKTDLVVGFEIETPSRQPGAFVPLGFNLDKNCRIIDCVSEAAKFTPLQGGEGVAFDLTFSYSENGAGDECIAASALHVAVHAGRVETEGDQLATICYPSTYNAKQIERICDAWFSILETLNAGSDARIKDLCLIAMDERNLVTRKFNETRREFPKGECLPDLLREQARIQPDALAVVSEDQNLTFRQLAERSSDLAHYLQHIGVTLDDCVGLFVEPSVELMIGAWGILFAGGAYLPLSPEYPEERIRYMIENSRTKVIFSQEKLQAKLSALVPAGTRIVTLQDVARFVKSHDRADQRLDNNLRPNNLAYIIYTSGSTGTPKGVMIEHHSIVNQMHWLRDAYAINHETVILQKTPMSFDAAQWEILAPACGSRVVMGTPGIYREPERLIETISKHGVTALQCVPTLLQALIDTQTFHECRSLTQVFSGGEALTKHLALECLAVLPACKLVNLYGPTECTINASAFAVDPRTLLAGPSTISVGAPVANTSYYILDDCLQPVGVGEVGELYIGGEQLARGYLFRPDLTAEKFINDPFHPDAGAKLYRTGDLASWNADGTVQFAGRADNQIKLRGFRIELDEIKLAIEAHHWVKHAGVVVNKDQRTGRPHLVAFLELNPKEAALMDQGNHGAHHLSKKGKTQVKAQLSNPGLRDAEELTGKASVDLPGKTPTSEQKRRVFARKTYRFYEGGAVQKADILRLLAGGVETGSRSLDTVSFAEFGEILRYFGQYGSDERLLPKYGYASPGALYATQMYLEIDGIGDLTPGYYYYHPMHHQLILIREKAGEAVAKVKLHFIGKKRAIEPIYKNNIQEVFEIETGHMVGLFEVILPGYGLGIREFGYDPAEKGNLSCADEDFYLGTFEIVPNEGRKVGASMEVYVQAHPGRVSGLAAGLYRYTNGDLEKLSDEIVLKKQVIAINQEVYERASFGITVISKSQQHWMGYIDLGRKLQQLQMNDVNLGFMSSGYSSKSGHDLPSAKRIESILRAHGQETGPSYFFVGGRISDEQIASEGMKEDAVHMKGPSEMIKDDLIRSLPDYMIPNCVVILDKMPLTANGKIDGKALEKMTYVIDRPFVEPRTTTEERLCKLWKKEMKTDTVSVQDDFFEVGGNSLIAVSLVHKINKEFQCSLPLQVLFEAPTIEKLARKITGQGGPSTRLVPLQLEGSKPPIYCWPGLGGYTMNLRLLASRMGVDRPFHGVQVHGINKDEVPYRTIKEMAAEDVEMIKKRQPTGPYTLWGYSFGARVAFETAYQLEQRGDIVENLFLIAPGSPKLRGNANSADGREASYADPAYVTILYSVFAGSITGGALEECLRTVTDEASFIAFICGQNKDLDAGLVKRIVRIVGQTYEFKYSFHELAQRQVKAPITIFRASGDDYSFIEGSSGYSSNAPTVIDLDADHYGLLKDPGVDELVRMIRYRARVVNESAPDRAFDDILANAV